METIEFVNANIGTMTVSAIARLIHRHWAKVNYGAEPYLEAMVSLESVNDPYYKDSGKSVVLYFLANAGTWRGDVAKAVKSELKKRVGSN